MNFCYLKVVLRESRSLGGRDLCSDSAYVFWQFNLIIGIIVTEAVDSVKHLTNLHTYF